MKVFYIDKQCSCTIFDLEITERESNSNVSLLFSVVVRFFELRGLQNRVSNDLFLEFRVKLRKDFVATGI